MATVAELGLAALQDLGVYGAGETASAEDSDYCLVTLNRLVDQAAAERLMMFKVTRSTWTISTTDGSYTIGPSANIAIPWPTYVEKVAYEDTAETTPEEVQLTELTDQGYQSLSPKTLAAELPSHWYFDRAFDSSGQGNLILWPTPDSATLRGVIYAATQVAEFSAVTDTVALPKGYREWIVCELAARMAPAYNRLDVLPRLDQLAERARRTVKSANSRLVVLGFDAGATQGVGRRYDIRTDQ